jgi:predicted metal-binding transcription factor (methanogenesis marker protein 9)
MATKLGLHSDGSFRFHIPVKLEKSEDGKRWIKGVASTEDWDLQDEKVLQSGLDFQYFLKKGFFNDNHSRETGGKVGVPTDGRITPAGFYVEGYLLETPRADAIWDLADSLDKAGGDRRLGMSIEGKVKRRDGKIIKASWVKDVAITAEPINPGTFMSICKSLAEEIDENGYIDKNGEVVIDKGGKEERFWVKMRDLVGDELKEVKKALTAGHKGVAPASGTALVPEDLEKDIKVTDEPVEERKKKKKKKEAKKSLTKEEAIQFIVERRGVSEETAGRIYDAVEKGKVKTIREDLKINNLPLTTNS